MDPRASGIQELPYLMIYCTSTRQGITTMPHASSRRAGEQRLYSDSLRLIRARGISELSDFPRQVLTHHTLHKFWCAHVENAAPSFESFQWRLRSRYCSYMAFAMTRFEPVVWYPNITAAVRWLSCCTRYFPPPFYLVLGSDCYLMLLGISFALEPEDLVYTLVLRANRVETVSDARQNSRRWDQVQQHGSTGVARAEMVRLYRVSLSQK